MAEQSAEAGAYGLLIVTTYYSRPSQDRTHQHTLAMANATELPVMLYDVLGRTVVRYSIATLERLAENSRGVAVKDATGDVQGASRVIDNGDVVGAQAVFLPVWPVIDLICGSGSAPLRCKLTLALLGVIPPAAMRLPQVAADEPEIAQVRQALTTVKARRDHGQR